MNIRDVALVLGATLLPALAAGCTTTAPSVSRAIFRLPVTGEFSDRTPAAGQATAYSDGHGAFWVQVPGGPRCSGTYNAHDPNPTLVVAGVCSDGKEADVVITRQADLMTGTAIVKLSDGRRGQFVFGNLTFDQAFGAGTAHTL